MKLLNRILLNVWLCTVVISNLLVTQPYFNTNKLSFCEKNTEDKSADDNNEKNNEDESNQKSEKKDSDNYFEAKKNNKLFTQYYYTTLTKNLVQAANEQYVCTHSIELESPPPEQ